MLRSPPRPWPTRSARSRSSWASTRATPRWWPSAAPGPLFAHAARRRAGSRTTVVPPAAGTFSAWGLLGADEVREAAQTYLAAVDAAATARAGELVASAARGHRGARRCRRRARGVRRPAPPRPGARAHARGAAARRPSPTRWPTASAAPTRRPTCTRSTTRSSSWRCAPASGAAPPWRGCRRPPPARPAGPHQQTDAYSFTRARRLPFALVERATLGVGATLAGPAVIGEPTTTTYLDAGYAARVDASGCLVLEPEAP